MVEKKIKFILSITNDLHDSVSEIYEALMDEEIKESEKLLDAIIEKCKELKQDLSTKED